MRRDDVALHAAAPGRRVWLVFGETPNLEEIGGALAAAGWQIAGAARSLAEVRQLVAQAEPADIVVSGLRFTDGDGFQLMHLLAGGAAAPAVFIVSREQRAVIRAAAALAEACGMPVAGFAEQPIAAQRVAQALADYRRPPRRTRPAPLPLGADELLAMLDRGALGPWLQPKMRVQSHEIVGFEALMRAHDADGALVLPDRLIGALVQHGLLERATLTMAARTVDVITTGLERGLAVSASINVSMQSLASLDFCRELAATVERAGLDPSWITIEITETDAMTDYRAAIENTGRIRLLGFNLAIDDFGTAYASLVQLSRIPFSELKIERAFVSGIAEDRSKRAIVAACAQLGAALGLHVVAEGVETAQEFELVRAAGCTQVQGYWVARPMPAEQALDWLAALPDQRFEKAA